MPEIVHFSDDDKKTLCGESASPFINAVVDWPARSFCPDCVRWLKDQRAIPEIAYASDGNKVQWKPNLRDEDGPFYEESLDGEICFDCPCGDEIELNFGRLMESEKCECGRVYKLHHHVTVTKEKNRQHKGY